MVLTRQDAKTAFNHVLDNVIGRDDTSPLKAALKHDSIDDIFGLITIDDVGIDGLTYEDPSNTDNFLPVPRGDKNLLRIFRDYVVHRNNSGDPINDGWTRMITQANFDTFCVNPTHISNFARAVSVDYSFHRANC